MHHFLSFDGILCCWKRNWTKGKNMLRTTTTTSKGYVYILTVRARTTNENSWKIGTNKWERLWLKVLNVWLLTFAYNFAIYSKVKIPLSKNKGHATNKIQHDSIKMIWCVDTVIFYRGWKTKWNWAYTHTPLAHTQKKNEKKSQTIWTSNLIECQRSTKFHILFSFSRISGERPKRAPSWKLTLLSASISYEEFLHIFAIYNGRWRKRLTKANNFFFSFVFLGKLKICFVDFN